MTSPDDRSSASGTQGGAADPADTSTAAGSGVGASPAGPRRQPVTPSGGADAPTTAIPSTAIPSADTPSTDTPSTDAAGRAGAAAADQPSTAAYDPRSDYTGGSLYSRPVQDDPVDVERAKPTTVLPAAGASEGPAGLGLQDQPPAPFPAAQSTESSPSYAPAGSDQRDYTGVEPSGFFSGPGQQLPPRVELAPRRNRFGQNLLGAVVGVLFAAIGALVYALLVRPDNGLGFGDKFGLVASVVLAALPGLLIGWSAAAAWFPGLLLTAAGVALIFVDQVTTTAGEWSVRVFDRADPVQFFATVGFAVGVALLFAGIAGHIARRAGENATIERIQQQP